MNNTSCILTVIKNEHEYLDEWIKYHIDLGIDHIFIFEDIDSDSHKEICDKYGNKVSLDSVLVVLDEINRNKAIELKRTRKWNAQHIYFRSGLKYIEIHYKGLYDWCFVIDNDEFITLQNKDINLKNVLSLYEDYDAFVMQWKCYGANGLVNKPNYGKKGVIDTYISEAKGEVPDTRDSFIKTCHNLNTYRDEFFHNQHHPSDKSRWCNTNFIKDRYNHSYDNIYIRHYITKSWEEYVWKRKTRGYVWGGARNFDFFFAINPDMLDKKKELIDELDKEMLVVLPYKQSASQGNEIRMALRGWKKYCRFPYHFVVIGEFDEALVNEFPWVEFIVCPQLENKEGQYNPHLNVQHCIEILNKRFSNIYNGFITMADDEYAIKDFCLDDIMTIHHHSLSFVGSEKSPTSFWSHDKWKTRQLLDRENLPHVNYTTHYPCFFEFKRLKEICRKFNLSEESYVLEDIYFNYFKHEEPILDSQIRFGVWGKEINNNEFNKAIENPSIKFMCNSNEGWSKEFEDNIRKLTML